MKHKRLLAVFGTRPEAVKMAPVVSALRKASGASVSVCVTGQHRHMLDQVLRLFGIEPEYDLNVMRPQQTLTDITVGVLQGMEAVLRSAAPDIVLVHGDTTTASAASLAAFYQRIEVAHIEAGLRTGDLESPWPEEANRRLVAVLSKTHFSPTERARDNLLREGVAAQHVHVTGNTVIDALKETVGRIEVDRALCATLEKEYGFLNPLRRLILVTGHRRENLGGGLGRICQALEAIASRGDVDIVYPVHLNPGVSEPVSTALGRIEGVHLMPPLDYVPFVYLLSRSHLVITDSGGVQEEAPALGKPVLVTRNVTERPEAIDAGVARLVGTDTEQIVAAANKLLDSEVAYSGMAKATNPFGDGTASTQIARILMS